MIPIRREAGWGGGYAEAAHHSSHLIGGVGDGDGAAGPEVACVEIKRGGGCGALDSVCTTRELRLTAGLDANPLRRQ